MSLDGTRGLYNIDVLWAKILDVMLEAQSARLVRVPWGHNSRARF